MGIKINEKKRTEDIINDMKSSTKQAAKDSDKMVYNLQVKFSKEELKDEVLNDLLKKMNDTQLRADCLTYVCGTFCCKLL